MSMPFALDALITQFSMIYGLTRVPEPPPFTGFGLVNPELPLITIGACCLGKACIGLGDNSGNASATIEAITRIDNKTQLNLLILNFTPLSHFDTAGMHKALCVLAEWLAGEASRKL